MCLLLTWIASWSITNRLYWLLLTWTASWSITNRWYGSYGPGQPLEMCFNFTVCVWLNLSSVSVIPPDSMLLLGVKFKYMFEHSLTLFFFYSIFCTDFNWAVHTHIPVNPNPHGPIKILTITDYCWWQNLVQRARATLLPFSYVFFSVLVIFTSSSLTLYETF